MLPTHAALVLCVWQVVCELAHTQEVCVQAWLLLLLLLFAGGAFEAMCVGLLVGCMCVWVVRGQGSEGTDSREEAVTRSERLAVSGWRDSHFLTYFKKG